MPALTPNQCQAIGYGSAGMLVKDVQVQLRRPLPRADWQYVYEHIRDGRIDLVADPRIPDEEEA